MLLSKSGRLGSGRKGSGALGLGERVSEHWEIDPREIQIMRRPDGSPWLLGEGASSTVRRSSTHLGRGRWGDSLGRVDGCASALS
jgi:hypothetical protein